MRCELLSPAGNMETLYSAVMNGADSVYLAGKQFGARANATNFSHEELKEAIDFAHLYGVKIYVTVNTIIYQDEIDRCIEYIKFLYLNNVDALIMQDIGMIKLVKQLFPNLDVHASTQCHNHNKESIDALVKLGVSRIVLDREMSLKEINNLDVSCEKEIFIHGALCVSYSGCCLFSSLNGGRSGNRGLCVGSCRLPYKLIKNDEIVSTNGNYLLSMRELNTIDRIEEILKSDVACLKIEGRMKSREYVGYVTRMYRNMIDNYYNGKKVKLTKEEQNNLATLFNRKFTNGYLFNDEVINISSPNHQGSSLGKVIAVNSKRIKIKLDTTLAQGDGIRFKKSNLGMIVNKLYNEKDMLINKASRNQIVEVDNKLGLKEKDIANKTIDSLLLKEINSYPPKKIPIDIKVEAFIGKPLQIEFNDGINKVNYASDIVEIANNNPVTADVIKEKISKLGNSVYTLRDIEIFADDNIFISLKPLNNVRRILVDMLNKERIKPKYEFVINEEKRLTYNNTSVNTIKINALVRTEEQLKCCLENKVDNIYVVDYNLYNDYKHNNNIFYQTTRVKPKLLAVKDAKILATELASVSHYAKENEVVSDYYLNVVNNEMIDYLKNLGVKRITLSLELDMEQLKLLNHNNTELIIYGRAVAMLTKYCPLKECLHNCAYCKNDTNKYYLEDRLGCKFPITHRECITQIMDCKVINNLDKFNDYIEMGISNYRLELFDENASDIIDLLMQIRSKIN